MDSENAQAQAQARVAGPLAPAELLPPAALLPSAAPLPSAALMPLSPQKTPMSWLALCDRGLRDVFRQAMQTEQVQELRSRLEEYERLNLRSLARELDGMMCIVSADRAWPDGMTRPRSFEYMNQDRVAIHLTVTYQYWNITEQASVRIAMSKFDEDWFMERPEDILLERDALITVKHMGSDEYVPVICLSRLWWTPARRSQLKTVCTIFKNGDQLNVRLRGQGVPDGVSLPCSPDGSEEWSYCPLTIRIVGE